MLFTFMGQEKEATYQSYFLVKAEPLFSVTNVWRLLALFQMHSLGLLIRLINLFA